MFGFKKMILIGATALTLGAGAAISAQAEPLTTPYVDRLSWQVGVAAREGRISRRDARELRDELGSVHDLAWRNQTGDLRGWEYRRLAGVVHDVEARISDRGWDRLARYGDGYGYDRGGWRR